jgi:hypothetical protein
MSIASERIANDKSSDLIEYIERPRDDFNSDDGI